jgi:hypothetical protein
MCECGILATRAEPLDLKVHEESEDEPGVDEGAPGAQVLDSIDDMDEDNEILFEIGLHLVGLKENCETES